MQLIRVSRRRLATLIGLYLLAQVGFLINIQFPAKVNFDEFHYVPSAKQFLSLQENQNWEHPPLGKEIMAIGIALWGDRPIGWRFMSTLFGALTLCGMYLWGLAVFRREEPALWVAAFTLVNQLLYVQARIGMLDTFMWTFLVWGLAAFCAAWRAGIPPERARKLLAFTGLMFGLGTACKWFGVIPWAWAVGSIALIRLFQAWTFAPSRPSAWQSRAGFQEWYGPELLKGVSWGDLAISLGLIPLIAYYVTFLPFLFVQHTPPYGLGDLLYAMQERMWSGQQRVVNSHPYMSNWLSWPWMIRPIWYAFDKEGSAGEWVRGVLLIGNPAILWPGLAAVAFSIWTWIARRSREGFLISASYLAFFLCWAVIPRKVSFFYYYYPAGMTLSLAIVHVLDQLEVSRPETSRKLAWAYFGIAVALFVYFFPILAALKIPTDTYRRWMWLSSWI